MPGTSSALWVLPAQVTPGTVIFNFLSKQCLAWGCSRCPLGSGGSRQPALAHRGLAGAPSPLLRPAAAQPCTQGQQRSSSGRCAPAYKEDEEGSSDATQMEKLPQGCQGRVEG